MVMRGFSYLCTMIILATLLAYFAVLLLVSRLAGGRSSSNAAFFTANRHSPWYMVAFGMVGASISGVTFVSVPGMVLHSDMTYLQMCLGFIPGYFIVAFLLLPLYYRLGLTSIYTYLGERLGPVSYKTGAWFFLLSKVSGAAVAFYVVCALLQRFVFDAWGVPFAVTATLMVLLIWLYTRRGGIKTLVWTDSLQTLCLFAALLLIIAHVVELLELGWGGAAKAIFDSPMSRVFVFDDWFSRQNFWKQFLSGVFVVVVMTGLDQDKMQKNLTCRTLRDAQKDMCSYGFAFLPANFLFLSLGVLLALLAIKQGVALPAQGDELLPMFAATGSLGTLAMALFTLGIVAASFSSADSALTSLTTCFCVDICGRPDDEKLRHRTHFFMGLLFVVFMLMFRMVNSTSVIDAIYILVSYTYGPLLGLFAFGLFTKRGVNDRLVPFIAVASPPVCLALDVMASRFLGYKFGYELLLLNGLLTFFGLLTAPVKKRK